MTEAFCTWRECQFFIAGDGLRFALNVHLAKRKREKDLFLGPLALLSQPPSLALVLQPQGL